MANELLTFGEHFTKPKMEAFSAGQSLAWSGGASCSSRKSRESFCRQQTVKENKWKADYRVTSNVLILISQAKETETEREVMRRNHFKFIKVPHKPSSAADSVQLQWLPSAWNSNSTEGTFIKNLSIPPLWGIFDCFDWINRRFVSWDELKAAIFTDYKITFWASVH